MAILETGRSYKDKISKESVSRTVFSGALSVIAVQVFAADAYASAVKRIVRASGVRERLEDVVEGQNVEIPFPGSK